MIRCRRLMFALTLLALHAVLFSGCTGIPKGVSPVQGFEAPRYLGTWYEVARLDHSFERGLDNVSATYAPREDGGIDVVNRGYDRRSGEWKEARGRAYFMGDRSVGRLKATFFRPFYGAYNIIGLDRKGYSWSLVCGPNKDYLWILSRTPALDKQVLGELTEYARGAGFPVSSLIYPVHDRAAP